MKRRKKSQRTYFIQSTEKLEISSNAKTRGKEKEMSFATCFDESDRDTQTHCFTLSGRERKKVENFLFSPTLH